MHCLIENSTFSQNLKTQFPKHPIILAHFKSQSSVLHVLFPFVPTFVPASIPGLTELLATEGVPARVRAQLQVDGFNVTRKVDARFTAVFTLLVRAWGTGNVHVQNRNVHVQNWSKWC